MRIFFLIFAFFEICHASRLQFILPAEHDDSLARKTFTADSLHDFNKKVLGIEAVNSTNDNLFEKPNSLLVISIEGLDNLLYEGDAYDFSNEFVTDETRDVLKAQFGDEMLHIDVNSSGVFGSHHFKRDAVFKESNEDSTHQDIQNMFNLAKIIREQDRKTANSVDYYRIHLDASNARTQMEKRQWEEDVKRGIDHLQEAIKDSRGRPVVSEIYTYRQTSEKEAILYLGNIRKMFQVTRPRHHDFPATFAICAAICLAMLFASISMIWFMWDENEMGKNSIVYRLTTGRQKKD